MISLKVNSRKIIGKKVKSLRRNNLIPAVIYGRGSDSINIEVNLKLFEKIFHQAGTNTIIDLAIDDKNLIKTLIHEVQYDALSDQISHIDFYRIKEKEKVTVEVTIKLIGEAPAVKEKGGTLVNNLNKIKIEALPKDLIHEIEVDISKLADFHALIRVKDLKFSPEIKILNDLEEVVVSISAPHVEEEPVAKVEQAVSTEATAATGTAEAKKLEGTAKKAEGATKKSETTASKPAEKK